MNKKIVAILVCWLASLITVGSFMYAYGTGTISDATFEAGTQVESASYVIWREDSTYYSKNGSTGTIESSANASALTLTAIAAAPDYGRLYFLAGTYSLDVPINITKPLIIDGSYPTFTIIDSFDEHAFRISSNYVTVRNVRIQGNQEGQSAGGCAIYCINQTGVTVEHCWVNGTWGTSIQIENSNNITIKNNRIYNGGETAGVGISVRNRNGYPDSHDIVIEGNCIYNCYYGGISVTGWQTGDVYRVTISNNIFATDGGDGSGIILEINVNQSSIVGNEIEDTGRAGIYLITNCSHNTVTGNTVRNSREGIAVSFNCEWNTVTGNILLHNDNQGILVYSGSHNNTINGNTATGALEGIRVDDSNWNKISGNVLEGDNYGIAELATSNYNTFIDNTGIGGTAGISTTGAQTQCNLCYNNTSWIS